MHEKQGIQPTLPFACYPSPWSEGAMGDFRALLPQLAAKTTREIRVGLAREDAQNLGVVRICNPA